MPKITIAIPGIETIYASYSVPWTPRGVGTSCDSARGSRILVSLRDPGLPLITDAADNMRDSRAVVSAWTWGSISKKDPIIAPSLPQTCMYVWMDGWMCVNVYVYVYDKCLFPKLFGTRMVMFQLLGLYGRVCDGLLGSFRGVGASFGILLG